jgi:hypothetical protein
MEKEKVMREKLSGIIWMAGTLLSLLSDFETVVEIKGNGNTDGEERKAVFQLHLPKFRKNTSRLEFWDGDVLSLNAEGNDIPSPCRPAY